MPAVVDTEPTGRYVVKFRGAGQGPKALIAEVLAAGLAEELGLPLPQPSIVTLDEGFGRGEPDPEIQDVLRGSIGENFGLAYLASAFGFDAAADLTGVDPALAAAIVWFDAYVANPDRTPRNPNLLVWHDRIWLIDHGACLYFHHRWASWQQKVQAGVPQIRDHVLLPRAHDLAAADERLRSRLTEAVIRQVVAQVPESWLGGEPIFPDVAAQREVYVSYLVGRLAAPRTWLTEVVDARRQR